jgi:GNAT superfamily N-acetyltransferase
MTGTVYLEMGPEALDLVRPLWEKLNEHHLVRSPDFRRHYEEMTFESRKEDLLRKERLRVILAAAGHETIGYCFCSIEGDTGEIDSIFVDEPYRRSGVGETLVHRALDWLEAGGARKKIVAVAAGNEAAIPFYEQFGFVPRLTVLELAPGKR